MPPKRKTKHVVADGIRDLSSPRVVVSASCPVIKVKVQLKCSRRTGSRLIVRLQWRLFNFCLYETRVGANNGCLPVINKLICYVMLCVMLFSRSCSLYAVARLSVCRLSVTLMHPTQAIEISGNISTAFGTLAIRWHHEKFYRDRPRGTHPPGELNTRGVAKYSDFGPIERYISETVPIRRYR